MDSMNTGKAIAQGSHAAAQFINYGNTYAETCHSKQWQKSFKDWNDGGFGTTIVLGVDNLSDMEAWITGANIYGYYGEAITDETYPLRDGEAVHYFPVKTCGYIFDHDGKLKENYPGFECLKLR
jgi:hypothetical protein